MMCNIVIGASVTAFYIAFREQVIAMFINNSEVIAHGVKMLTALMVPGTVLGILFIINFSFQGMGKGIQSLILAVSRQGLVFLPTMILMDRFVGLDGIIWAQPAADFFCIALAIIMFTVTTKKMQKKTL